MKHLALNTLMALAALTPSLAWSNVAVARVDAKKTLSITPGTYVVSDAVSGFERENICVDGIKHTISWADSDTLVLGGATTFSDFNSGLKTDSQPYYPDHCSFRRSTQAEANRLIDDNFSNCAVENTTTHTEIRAEADTLIYSADMKISRIDKKTGKAKVVSVTSNCTLKRVPDAPTAAPADAVKLKPVPKKKR